MRIFILYLLFFFLAVFPGHGFALDPERGLGEYNNNQWGVDEQLPQISVTALVQDETGYIWIGTQNGVVRFNGKEFIAFDRSNTKVLQSNIINDLLIDRQQNLWILTAIGLTILEGSEFIAIKDPKNLIIKPSRLIEFEQLTLISASSGLFKVVKNKILPHIISSESYALESYSNELLVGGRGQLTIIKNGIPEIKKLPPMFNKAVVNDIQVVGQELWLATNQGLLFYQNGEFYQLDKITALTNEPTNSLYLDENQILWVATDIALYRLKDRQLHKGDEKPSYQRVSRFMRDKDETLWMGTSDRGLYQLWDSWSVRYGDYHGLNENLIWSVTGSDLSNLIVGSDKGVYKFNKNRFQTLINNQQLPDPSAYTLFIDDDESIWVGTKGGIAHFDRSGTKIIEKQFDALLGLQINAIFRDSQAALWVLTEQGVYQKSGENFKQIGVNTLFAGESFRAVAEVNNKIYLGSQMGLLFFEYNSSLKAVDDSRLKTFITSLDEYQGQLIVGTYSEGLFLQVEDRWKNLNKTNGLVFNDSFSLNKLNNSLWVSGFDGVYRLSFESLDSFIQGEKLKVVSDAILNDSGYVAGSQKAYCCNGAGHAKSAVINGDLWFPTRKGVLKLEPDKVHKNTNIVKTVIETLSSSQYQIDMYFYPESKPENDKIAFDERDINFKFIGLTSFDPGLVKYRYKLTGYSEQWLDNGRNRSVTYTNLPQGDYIFEVIASNNNGIWAKQPTQLAFTINPRYYETIYFRLLVILASLTLLFALYRLAIYRNKRNVEVLERMVLEKTKALVVSNQKLAEANQRLSIFSYTDPLTGAHNRRYLVKQIISDISHYVRNIGKITVEQDIVFLLVDLDFFKDINDTYGHSSGDEVLKQVVKSLQENIRDGDYLIRWGGEEFLIVLRPDHVLGIEEMCTRLLCKINKGQFTGINGESIDLTISIGYSFYPMVKQVVNNWSWEEALEIADQALYQAKNNGRNQWVGYQLLPNIVDKFSPQIKHNLKITSFQRFSGDCKMR